MAIDIATAPWTVEQVADRFDEFTVFRRRFERELEMIAAAEVPLSQATANRLTVLVGLVQRAADIRVGLARMAPSVLMAGVALWINRQSGHTPVSAVERAALVWTARQLGVGGQS